MYLKLFRSRRALSALGAIALIAVFMILLACMSFTLIEYNRYGESSKLANEVVVAKSRESLGVVQVSSTLINVTNEGSTPSLIVGIFRVKPADKNPNYQTITPVTVPLMSALCVSIPNTPEKWLVGVVTSYGNVFWEEATGGAVEYVPPGETAYVTFAAEGLGSDASGTVLTVDGVSYTYSQLPKTFAWTSGSTHRFAWSSPVSGSSGVRYVWTSTRGLSTKQQDNSFIVNANGYIIATYKTQCSLTINANPSAGGSTSPSPGTYWNDPGSTVQISATANLGYAFDQWVGSGSGSYTGTANPTTVTINGPASETAYFFSFSVSVSPSSGTAVQGGSVSATVTVTYESGYGSKTISLSASGLPSGATAGFNPPSGSPTYTSTMTIATASTTPTGTYTITITGTGGGLTRTTQYTLTVTKQWLSGWSYRRSHVIIGSTAGAVTDYQIRITVHYGGGTDSGENVYLSGKCRSDFGDIRFTSADGVTLLSYWMETYVASNYAAFWVKVPSIPASPSSTTIYIYYGKADATTTSNGANTFLSFRDLSSDFYNALGAVPLTTYSNCKDPGDYFVSSQTVGSVYLSPCIWFRYYGGKKYSISSDPKLHFEGYVDAGNYGTCGTDIRMRTDVAPTGWQTSNTYKADSRLDKKHIIVLDYQMLAGSGGLVFYSSWNVGDDIPSGTTAASYALSSTTRTVAEYVYAGSIAHIRLESGSSGNSINIYREPRILCGSDVC